MTTKTPTKRKPRTHRVPDPLPLEITPSRRKILQLLHHYRYLTPRQLALAYHYVEFKDPEKLTDEERARFLLVGPVGPGETLAADTKAAPWDGQSLSHVRHELGRLYHNGPGGYVEHHYQAKRPTGEGSEQFIYTLTRHGAREILTPEQYAAERSLIYRREERKRGYYDHHLALSTLQLILELAQQPWTVARFGGDEHRKRFVVDLDGAPFAVQPDAWVKIRYPNGQHGLYLFEVDLSHHLGRRLDKRTQAYARYLTGRDGAELKKNEQVNNVVVVYVEPTEAQVEAMITRTVRNLRELGMGRRQAPLFLFMNLEDWYETKTLARKQRPGTPDELVRKWTVPWLRPPGDIHAEANVANLAGELRQLVQSTG